MIATERGLRFQETTDLLRSAGYHPIGRIRLSRYQMLAVLTMAVNQIAWITNRVPIRVYQCLLVKFGNTARGVIARPENQGQGRARGRQEKEALHVFCPCCGADLLAAGPPTFDEIAGNMAKMRSDSPQKSPHSRESEGKASHFKGEEVAETGVEGMGGGDPTGAPVPHDPPHSPEP